MKKTKEPSGGEDDSPAVVLRRPKAMSPPTKSAPVLSPYNFMRRSCTFVAESSLGLRKSASRTTSMDQSAGIRTSLKGPMIPTTAPQKVVKDRKNLALQVRQKKDMLEENANGEKHVNGRMEQGVSGGGRMSRLVGGLRAWSSTEDVRQSFMGALGRTVSVIKQPRKAKQASAPNTRPSPSHVDSKAVPTKSNNIKTTSASTTTTTTTTTTTNNNYRATFNKSKSARVSDLKTEKQAAKRQTSKFQFGKTGEGKTKTSIPRSTPASDEPSSRSPNQANSRWIRHIQDAQEAYTAREGRNRRTHPHTPLQDPDDSTPTSSDALRDVDDGVEVDGGEAADTTAESLVDSKTQQGATKSSGSSGRMEELPAPAIPAQPPASPETLVKKTAEAGGSGSSGSGQGSPSPTAGRSPASGRRLQEVQIIQIVEGPTLIQPSEVKVSQGVVLSAEPVLTPIELLRRKDLKIRQALEEKQQIIANILNIPYEDFESVVDMAGEPAVGNKEPKELVLAAMFQAKCLQESLNEALNLTEGDIVVARANEGKATGMPLYQAPMTKLMNISTTLSQQLSSLLNLVSERDDERERMRKELVASRERLHLLHMRQNSAPSQTVVASSQTPSSSTQPTTSSPYTSRPSSFVSVTSSVADHSDTSLQHDTDEDGTEVSKGGGIQQEARPSDTREELLPENFEDTGSRSELTDTKPKDAEASEGLQENEEGARGNEEVSAT